MVRFKEAMRKMAEADATKRILACGNCSFQTTDEDELLPVDDIWERVSPGEVFPHGECPDCGALVHAVEQPAPIDEELIRRVIAHLKANGWELKDPAARVVLDPNPHPGEWSKRDEESWETYCARTAALFDAIPQSHIWFFPVADGSACYRVYNEVPLRFQHIPHGDAWAVPTHVIEGLDGAELRKDFFGSQPPQQKL